MDPATSPLTTKVMLEWSVQAASLKMYIIGREVHLFTSMMSSVLDDGAGKKIGELAVVTWVFYSSGLMF
jgi:hypothetical protein